LLVDKKQLYIHRIHRPGQVSEITSIVAVTRDSDPVIAITKVFTSKKWRRRGWAEELVRFVCRKYV
jgi:predicted GNAT family acetyltransferase